jgi:lipopolysaccharide/colanic/teichoic acid biosynthesis glycosyltransferase
MIQGVDRRGLKVTASGDRRITKVGNFLRKTKLDEVPQLFNVLRGEMSLVGPRPEVPEYVARYNRRQKQVLEVQPGVTGIDALLFVDESRLLASRPDRESFYVGRVMPCKVEINLTYCRSVSFLGDLEIILLTLGRLLAPSLFSNGTLKDCLRTLGVQEPLLALRSLSGPGPEA